ncbi:hypothetical protein PVAP13_5KG199407 [Panicum virgatum]|uniref:Uncharacterized protein n=1 Tax=Panicum virgatum TaxID=38727 RepID=A0A8T0SL61_PANVG|nr:hypothetical protein PVAP13_5KG199407 [Panicum virgatum]
MQTNGHFNTTVGAGRQRAGPIAICPRPSHPLPHFLFARSLALSSAPRAKQSAAAFASSVCSLSRSPPGRHPALLSSLASHPALPHREKPYYFRGRLAVSWRAAPPPYRRHVRPRRRLPRRRPLLLPAATPPPPRQAAPAAGCGSRGS